MRVFSLKYMMRIFYLYIFTKMHAMLRGKGGRENVYGKD